MVNVSLPLHSSCHILFFCSVLKTADINVIELMFDSQNTDCNMLCNNAMRQSYMHYTHLEGVTYNSCKVESIPSRFTNKWQWKSWRQHKLIRNILHSIPSIILSQIFCLNLLIHRHRTVFCFLPACPSSTW